MCICGTHVHRASQDINQNLYNLHVKLASVSIIRTCVTSGERNRVSSPSQVIHLQYKAQAENIKISNKTHHFEYGPTRRSFSDREHLTDRAVATFWTTTKPRRKEVPQCTMGKPVLRRRFEKRTYHKQIFFYCANVLRYCVNLVYPALSMRSIGPLISLGNTT